MKQSIEADTFVATHYESEKSIQGLVEDLDIGAKLAHLDNAHGLSAAENRSVLLRIDIVLMPLMFISYGLQYMDKALLSSAAQFNIVEDLNLYDVALVGGKPVVDLKKFSYATMIFYWGFVLGSFPSSYLAQRFPIGRFCGVAVAVWGAITMATAGVKSYAGMMVIRFFLGFVEAAIPAAFSLIVAMWYKKDEQPLRFSVWVSASGFGGIVGSILLWGIGHLNGALSPWQYQFIILGALTVGWGIILFFILPNNPVEARFLSENEKILAVKRMREGQTGIENTKFKSYQAREAVLDIKTWLYILVTLCLELVNGAVSGFASVIINSFGFSPFKSVLVTGALGAVIFVTCLVGGVLSVFARNQRCNIATFCCIPIIVGSALVWKASWATVATPLAGFMLLGFFVTPYVMILSLMSANTGGHTKKAVTAAMVWGAYCASNGVAPLLVRTTEAAKHYPSLFIPLMALLSLCAVVLLGLQFYLRNCNKKRDAVSAINEVAAAQTAFADLTDKENPNFRYSW